MAKNNRFIDRRTFIKSASGATATAMMGFPHIVAGQSGGLSPNDKLNLAFIGVGGKGATSIMPINDLGHNIIGLCDVDERSIAKSVKKRGNGFSDILDNAVSRGGRWYKDYRKMFEDLDEKLDGIVISTPDHMHFPIAMSAVNLGINVYCEKPLTHTVDEARRLAAAAKSHNVITQMGNQGHSNDGVRQLKELIAAGVIGQVREVYSWTNRPIWPQGLMKPKHNEFIPVVPKELDWELWQGVAPQREYDPAYLPFSWRNWWDYGCGAVGDMGCHVMDAAYYGLELGLPDSVEAMATNVNSQSAPSASAITYQFPKRGKFAAVTYHWLDGGLLPPIPKGLTKEDMFGDDHSGTLFIGDDGQVLTDTYTETVRVFPESRSEAIRMNPPPQTIERVTGTHQADWIQAIVEGRKACSDWDYAAGLTEVGLLGNVAIRTGTRIDYDSQKMRVRNLPEANKFLSKEYPKGWILS